MKAGNKGFLSQEGLKLIACVTMLIDHIGITIVPHLPVPYMAQLYYCLRGIGRIAFPIYAFLLAEGMRHTHDPGQYLLRLGVGILLSELPFDLMLKNGLTWGYQSVMVTLMLGAMMILCMQKLPKDWMKPLVLLPFLLVAEQVFCDYGAWGVLMIGIFAMTDCLWIRVVCIAAINCMVPSASIPLFGATISIQVFGALAMIPIACYNGRKITRNRLLQWGFYLFYPVHMLILWLMLQFGF